MLFVSNSLSHTHHPKLNKNKTLHLPNKCNQLTSKISNPPTLNQTAFFADRALY